MASIRLVRERSDTPTVQSSDDARAFRYAYWGQSGIIKGYGFECAHEIDGLNFIVKHGEFVIDGQAAIVPSTNAAIPIDNIAVLRYYVVYAEININGNTADILSIYDTADFPTVEKGDDLTTVPNGVARLPLYRFIANAGLITEVTLLSPKIKQGLEYLADINTSLEQLKDGVEDGTIVAHSADYVVNAENNTRKKIERIIGTNPTTPLGYQIGDHRIRTSKRIASGGVSTGNVLNLTSTGLETEFYKASKIRVMAYFEGTVANNSYYGQGSTEIKFSSFGAVKIQIDNDWSAAVAIPNAFANTLLVGFSMSGQSGNNIQLSNIRLSGNNGASWVSLGAGGEDTALTIVVDLIFE